MTLGLAEFDANNEIINIELDTQTLARDLKAALKAGFADGIEIKLHYTAEMAERMRKWEARNLQVGY